MTNGTEEKRTWLERHMEKIAIVGLALTLLSWLAAGPGADWIIW